MAWLCGRWQWIKSRRPVTRGRYERELELLRLSVNRSIEEEKRQLQTLMMRLSHVDIVPGTRRLRVQMMVNDDLVYLCRSPYERKRLFFEIAESIARQLEQELEKAPISYEASYK